MKRIALLSIAFLLAVPAIADDDKEDRDNGKRAVVADCERQANKQNLIGKERKKFVKACSKEGGHGKRRDRVAAPPSSAPPQSTAPVTPAPATATVPAQPAGASTPPPSTPASQAGTGTAAKPRTAPGSPERRVECEASPEYKKALLLKRKEVLEKCMSAT